MQLRCFYLPLWSNSRAERSRWVVVHMNLSALKSPINRLLPLILIAVTVQGQTSATPERFQLLNGLRVILLSQPGDQDVLLKLRIHSGAAFDLAGKSGSMALLGDLLFPDPSTRE